MYERFTDRSRKVLQLASQEAQRLNYDCVETSHLLMGLIKEGSGVAANVLRNLGIDAHKVRLEIEAGRPSSGESEAGRLPHSPRLKVALESAIEQASILNDNFVGTEHLLLGLLGDPESVVTHIFAAFQVSQTDVREEVLNLLGQRLPPGTPPGNRRTVLQSPIVKPSVMELLVLRANLEISLAMVNQMIASATNGTL